MTRRLIVFIGALVCVFTINAGGVLIIDDTQQNQFPYHLAHWQKPSSKKQTICDDVIEIHFRIRTTEETPLRPHIAIIAECNSSRLLKPISLSDKNFIAVQKMIEEQAIHDAVLETYVENKSSWFDTPADSIKLIANKNAYTLGLTHGLSLFRNIHAQISEKKQQTEFNELVVKPLEAQLNTSAPNRP